MIGKPSLVSRVAFCRAGSNYHTGPSWPNIGSAVDLLVHIGRTKGQRAVSEIAAMRGFDNERNDCQLDALDR